MKYEMPSMSESLERSGRSGFEAGGKPQLWRHASIALLVCFFIITFCVSLRLSYPFYRESYIIYDGTRLYYAMAAVAAFASISLFFAFARFSFGYFVGFYFFAMVAGYLWLNSFSHFQYDHVAAGFSAAISAFVFLLPVLLITSPVKQVYVMPDRAFDSAKQPRVVGNDLSPRSAAGSLRNVTTASIERVTDDLHKIRGETCNTFIDIW
jgi:hypothetical protein